MKFVLVLTIIVASVFGNWKTERESLKQVYKTDSFHIFYSLSGKHALKNKKDLNSNKVPDTIENIGLQLEAAHKVYALDFHLKNPLYNSVYKNRARYMVVHVLNTKNSNGTTGDAVIKYRAPSLSRGSSIGMTISRSLKTGNLTPMHELFHMYQNGYTMIKNSWYSEGTARWAESIFNANLVKEKKLPQNMSELNKLFSSSYNANAFWHRLVNSCSSSINKSPKGSKSSKYIGVDKYIIPEGRIRGASWMKVFLKNLDFYDDMISKKYNRQPFLWKEKDQRSSINNKYISLSILKTIQENKEGCIENDEFKTFVNTLKEFTTSH